MSNYLKYTFVSFLTMILVLSLAVSAQDQLRTNIRSLSQDSDPDSKIEYKTAKTEISDLYNTKQESIGWIEGIPLVQARVKMYKLVALNRDLTQYFSKQASPPLDKVLLVLFYFVTSFLPSILFSLITSFFYSNKPNQLPRSGFVFNQQDVNDIQSILKLVQ